MTVRPTAVAGTWYPANPAALARDVDEYLEAAGPGPAGDVRAIVAPHAGLMFSGPVGAWAYKAVAGRAFDVAILVGPSHYEAFDGVALHPGTAFATPFGPVPIDRACAAELTQLPVVTPFARPHDREHSLEMQLPFLCRVLPSLPIVPLVMGYQTRETIVALGEALAATCARRRALLVASTDLSHFFDAATAETLDGRVQRHVAACDPDGLLGVFEEYPEHERGRYVACGGGPAIAVMMAARALGATRARVLKYGHSGEISGDYGGVVGYLAAAQGVFADA